MLTIDIFIENLKKIKEINSYIYDNKRKFPKCSIVDNMPFEIENAYTSGTGLMIILDYHLNKLDIDIESEVFNFIRFFEDEELSIEYDWEAEGHFDGIYRPGNYYNPPEYPDWCFDKFILTGVRVVNQNNDIILTIPEEYYNLIACFIDEYEISKNLEEYEAEHQDDYEYDDDIEF